jgi:hypothetical protein
MAALRIVALALAPRFVQFLNRRHDGPVDSPAITPSTRSPRHGALSCHWVRTRNGALEAVWISDAEASSPAAAGDSLLGDLPGRLLDDALRHRRSGSTIALIALGRLARLNHSRRSFCGH